MKKDTFKNFLSVMGSDVIEADGLYPKSICCKANVFLRHIGNTVIADYYLCEKCRRCGAIDLNTLLNTAKTIAGGPPDIANVTH